ncbi:MAG: hypothetical protein JAY75_24330 [Candidatus Thiodiazotropha taylori]|nr:hypothetical protein [Candidatus Thiodiazotropha taylori]MCW4226630.1 hypothetical protein [Candidatus Thiodiazotropha endolucinida]MCG7888192.1 hypothetical protein [Candidatus Thiodiazotropha taylori]MCG8033568.1 hypothetical protein [Candidatus Thiodiazotropha taylori]MCG8079334.1 hypothetical protein [Candidatus Thiodiazotropha taylori]
MQQLAVPGTAQGFFTVKVCAVASIAFIQPMYTLSASINKEIAVQRKTKVVRSIAPNRF